MILCMQNWLDGEKFDCMTGGWRGGAKDDDDLERWSNVYFLIRFFVQVTDCVCCFGDASLRGSHWLTVCFNSSVGDQSDAVLFVTNTKHKRDVLLLLHLVSRFTERCRAACQTTTVMNITVVLTRGKT